MAAMMLPSVMPSTLVFAGVSAEHQRRGRSFVLTWMFISAYLAAWTAYGLLAYGIFRAIQSAHMHAISWHAQGPVIAGAAIVAAGLYQLSPLKRRCLRQCWSPEQAGRGRMGETRLLGAAGYAADEPHMDDGGGRADLRGEGAPVRRAALAGVRDHVRGRRDLGRRRTGERPGPHPARKRSSEAGMRAMGMHDMNKGMSLRKTHTMSAEESGPMKMNLGHRNHTSERRK